ncbi:hypothetical protein JG687_00004227 [Phytophthora cactorum]|uniref:Uncharacterized protein n=1 Tax=Phytophthora cactorum TaxID=29920 RepID=A0A8T1US52_9STRA|nr:hypothetical protein JG687_00004227 [Phytophthora cactorum]
MLKEETSQDVAYSDDEFGSEHAYVGGDDEIAHENTEQEAAKQDSPVEADTEDAEQYDGEFDDDDRAEPGVGSQTLETGNTLVNQTPPDTDAITEAPQEDAEAYDGEFDEAEYTPIDADAILHDDETYDGEFDNDDPVVPDATPPTVDNYDTTMEQTPTATDSIAAVPQDNKETEENNRSDLSSPQNNDDDYTDEMKDEYPSVSNTSQFEGDEKSGDEEIAEGGEIEDQATIASLTEVAQAPEISQSVELPSASIAVKQDAKEAFTNFNPKKSPKPSQPENKNQPIRPKQPVKNGEPPAKQPSRPSTKKAPPPASSLLITSATDNKAISTPRSSRTRRRLLQPVRTPANLRFDLPKMDKTKRDWLFVNMFRHGDDLSKYEAFVPPTLLAKPPTAKETKKRPLSARQMYRNPYSSRFESSGRKLVPQPNPELQDRERNWVATTPHDSKLPTYDSILDKYCTRVTCPEVQRQIYQTRHRDLSPQLAFVLEKRVEKHYRKGFYDSFGGVSSYKTEIVPTPPSDGMRQLHMSPHSSTKSGLLKRQAISSVALEEEELLSAS